MHACEHLELASFVAKQACLISEAFAPLQDQTLYRYWSAARTRLDRWGMSFRRLRQIEMQNSEEDDVARNTLKKLIEEVLLSEPLTRLLTLLLEQRDRARNEVIAGPIARSIHLGSLDSRRRCLDILLNGTLLTREQVLELDALRVRLERWTDLLLGRSSTPQDEPLLAELAMDPFRARDFIPVNRQAAVESWPLLMASIRSLWAGRHWEPTTNEAINFDIAASILSMLEPPLFHESGLPRSLFLLRLQNSATDMQWMLENYEHDDIPPEQWPHDFTQPRRLPRSSRF